MSYSSSLVSLNFTCVTLFKIHRFHQSAPFGCVREERQKRSEASVMYRLMTGPGIGGYIVPETITDVEHISVHAIAECANTTHIGTMVVEPGASTSMCVADDVTETPTRIHDTVDAHNTDRVHSDPTVGVGYRATVKMKGGHAALRRTRGLIIHARTVAVWPLWS